MFSVSALNMPWKGSSMALGGPDLSLCYEMARQAVSLISFLHCCTDSTRSELGYL